MAPTGPARTASSSAAWRENELRERMYELELQMVTEEGLAAETIQAAWRAYHACYTFRGMAAAALVLQSGYRGVQGRRAVAVEAERQREQLRLALRAEQVCRAARA